MPTSGVALKGLPVSELLRGSSSGSSDALSGNVSQSGPGWVGSDDEEVCVNKRRQTPLRGHGACVGYGVAFPLLG